MGSFKMVKLNLDYVSPLGSIAGLNGGGVSTLVGANPVQPLQSDNLEAAVLDTNVGTFKLNLAALDGSDIPVSLVQNFTEIHFTFEYDKDKPKPMKILEIRGVDDHLQPFAIMQTFKDVEIDIEPMNSHAVIPLVGAAPVDPLHPAPNNATEGGDMTADTLDGGLPLLNLCITGCDSMTDVPETLVQNFTTIHLNLCMGSGDDEGDDRREESLAKRRHMAEMQAANLKSFERKKFKTFKDLCKAQGRSPEDIARCTSLAQLKHLARTGEAPTQLSFAGNASLAWNKVTLKQ